MAKTNMMTLVMDLILLSILLPIGLIYLYAGQFANVTVGGVSYILGDVVDPVLITLLTIILPIVIIVGIIGNFIKKKGRN